MQRHDSSEKILMWVRLMAGGAGTAEGELVGWHHLLSDLEFEEVGDGQGGLACCSPLGS